MPDQSLHADSLEPAAADLVLAVSRAQGHGLDQAARTCPDTCQPLVRLGLYMAADGMPVESLGGVLRDLETAQSACLVAGMTPRRWAALCGLAALLLGTAYGVGSLAGSAPFPARALAAGAGMMAGICLLGQACLAACQRLWSRRRQPPSIAGIVTLAVRNLQDGGTATTLSQELRTCLHGARTAEQQISAKRINHPNAALACTEASELALAANGNDLHSVDH